MRNHTLQLRTTVCALLITLAEGAHATEADVWKTYCEDARKAANERKHTEADQFMGMALGLAEKFGEADPRLVETLFLAARLQQARQKFPAAEPHWRRALALREAKLGPNHLSVAECAFYLGGNLTEQRKFEESESHLKRAEHIAKWKTSGYHPTVGTCQAALAKNFALAGRYDEAGKLYTAALKILGTQTTTTTFAGPNQLQESLFVPNYRRVMQIRLEQAQTLHLAKKFPDAEDAFKQLIKPIEGREGKGSDLLINPLLAFGSHYADVKKYSAAEALLLRRQVIIAKHVGEKHPEQILTLRALERVYREQGKIVEADALAHKLAEPNLKSGPEK